jgi:Xaa-Pro aminopeptidase
MPIIAVICSGQRSAHTNTTPSDRKIKQGDVVRFDLGARYEMYPSDLARTYVVGKANDSQNLYWDTIVAAEEAAMAALRPGVLAGEIFDIAVDTARRQGLPNFKRQHVGHGIGIDLYDMPILTPKNETPIEEGMVFCIETPCYEIGFAGFQVEDTMVVRPNGVELLSSLPRDMAYRG